MMNTGAMTVTTPTDREIVISRSFDAPCRLVFEAWTNPAHLPRWMTGPGGWTMTVCEIDLRAGGAWRFAWKGDDGAEMTIQGTYKEVTPYDRLVSTETWGGDWPDTLNTLILAEQNGKTTITNTVLYPSKEARDAALNSGMKEGMALSFDRLNEYVVSLA